VDGGYEEKEIASLCALIRPGDVVLDIGANIGLYTLPMSRAVGATGTVVAFEPDPDNLRILEHNVKTNKCDNVRIVPCALGSHEGEVGLYQVDDNRGLLSFADLGRTGKSVKVPVRRGDAVLRELAVPTPAALKIDVEGSEPLALAGLGCQPRYMQLEFVPAHLRALGLHPMAFLTSLVSDGYELAVIDRDTGELHATSPELLLRMADSTKLDYNLRATLT
jgi:FkbM family methyltransferase